jgi:NAD-specific glutamate dehydrogenase
VVEGLSDSPTPSRAQRGTRTDGTVNALVLTAGLTWRQVEVLRTLRNHLQQIRPRYSLETVNGVVLSNAGWRRPCSAPSHRSSTHGLGEREGDAQAQEELGQALDRSESDG